MIWEVIFYCDTFILEANNTNNYNYCSKQYVKLSNWDKQHPGGPGTNNLTRYQNSLAVLVTIAVSYLRDGI